MALPSGHGIKSHNDVKVLIADDEPMARERLRALIAEHADLQLVAEAGDGRAALTLDGGLVAPVSRRYARALREAGWW